MRVAVNVRLLIKNKLDGIGWFTYETMKRITASHPGHEFLFIFDRKYDPSFLFSPNIIPVIVPPPTRHPLLWLAWFEVSLPIVLKKHNVDLFLSPDGYLSLGSGKKQMSIIHDINFHHRPMDLPFSTRLYYRKMFPLFARKATRLGTVSHYSKHDIMNAYGVDEGKIDVMYNGANEMYRPLTKEEIEETREKYNAKAGYFIFIGTLHPRKNIARMLLAFENFREKINVPFKMIIVGEKMFMTSDIEQVYSSMQYSNDVLFVGRKSPLELKFLLGSATALSFVPLFEGFGIPVVEAMYCDVPVIASNVTSLPEIAGEAAIYADPCNVDSIADAMLKIVENISLRQKIIEAARSQKLKYSWDKTAASLWSGITKCFD